MYGMQVGNNALFSALVSLPHTTFDSTTVGLGPILSSMLLQIGGCVILVMTNLDLLAALLDMTLITADETRAVVAELLTRLGLTGSEAGQPLK